MNFMCNCFKKSFFPGDSEDAISIKDRETSFSGSDFRNGFVPEGTLWQTSQSEQPLKGPGTLALLPCGTEQADR